MEKDKFIALLKKIQRESDIPLSDFIKILKRYILAKEEGDVDRALELINTILSIAEDIVEINEILTSSEKTLEDLPLDLNTSEVEKKREKVNEICREGDYERALKLANEIPAVLEDLEESTKTSEERTTGPESEIVEKVLSPESNDELEDETEDIFDEIYSPREEDKDEVESIHEEDQVEESGGELTNIGDQVKKTEEKRSAGGCEKEQNEEGSVESPDIEDIIEGTQTIGSGSIESMEKETVEEKSGAIDVKDISDEINEIEDEVEDTPSKEKADKKEEEVRSVEEGLASEETKTIEGEREGKKEERDIDQKDKTEEELEASVEDKGSIKDSEEKGKIEEEKPKPIKDEEIDHIFKTSFEINKKMSKIRENDFDQVSKSKKKILLDELECCIGNLAEEEFEKALENVEKVFAFSRRKDRKTSEEGGRPSKDQISQRKNHQKTVEHDRDLLQIKSKLSKYSKMIFTMFTPFYSYFFPLALTIFVSIELITTLSLSIAVVPLDLITFLSPLPFFISRLIPQLLVSFIASSLLFFITCKIFTFEGNKLKISKKHIFPCLAVTIMMTASMGYHIYLSQFSFYKISDYLLFSLMLFLVSTQLDLLQNDFSVQD